MRYALGLLSKKEQAAYQVANGKGCYIYNVKKDGSLYKYPTYYRYYGSEKSPEDVIARLEELNPGSKFVAA